MAIPDIDPADLKLMNQARAAAAAKAAADKAAAAAQTNATADALRRLTSGATLTDAEKKLLGMGGSTASTTDSAATVTGGNNPPAGGGDNPPAPKTVKSRVDNGDGTTTVIYSDGTYEITGTKKSPTTTLDPATQALIASLQAQVSSQNALAQQQLAAQQAAAQQAAKEKELARQSAITVLTDRFKTYGLESLAAKIKELAVDGATEATITLGLQATDEYKQRFKANADRVKNNLRVLTPAEYLNLEDNYRQVLRAYGLKQFDNDEYVSQFISNDVSAQELSDRVVTAVQRVQNADPAIQKTLKDYYGIGNTDMVAYVLDPNQQLTKIQRQVAAAEIGTAARKQGLESGVTVAEQLAAQGVTQAEAQKGYATIADILPTAEKLSSIYGENVGTYNQATAEQEVFNSLASAQRARKRLTSAEVASFTASSGTGKSSLAQASSAGNI